MWLGTLGYVVFYYGVNLWAGNADAGWLGPSTSSSSSSSGPPGAPDVVRGIRQPAPTSRGSGTARSGASGKPITA